MTAERLERNVEVVLRDGSALRAWRSGAGEPLLLLHGFTGSVEAWGAPLLRELARRYDVIAVDLLGHGSSDGATQPERYSLQEILADLQELLDGAGLSSVTWVGYSMGGRIALAASVEISERVSGLVLESASPGLVTEPERAERREADGRLALDLEVGGVEPFVDRWMKLPIFESQSRLPPAVLQAARERRLRGDVQAWAACLRGLGTGSQPSYWDRLPSVGQPTLLITGGEDPKFCALGARMAGAIPAARHVEVGGVGHQVHLEAADAWLSHVLSSVPTG